MAYALLPRIDELAEKLLRIPSETPHHLQVQGDLEALQRMVRRIHAVLNDAENMEIHEESVRLWLRELKGVAYDADDVLDEYHYELLRAEVAAPIQADEAAYDLRYQQTHKDEGRLEKIWRRWFPRTAHHGHTVEASKADKIGKIRGRFEEISRQRDALHLREGDGERQSRNTGDRLLSSPLVDEQKIYGRGEDLEKVVNRLLCSDEGKKNNLSVLPIVGVGGVGKTTLVQHVYNDQRICGHFQIKGWVCVSDDFEVEKLTARIIESVTKRECHLKEFSVLQEKLKGLLDGKQFLLVLDDVWNEKRSLWESLQRPLRFGAQGSAVITTTRNESVAKIMQTMPFHRLNCLPNDDCWTVFIRSAFVDRDPDDCPDLVEIGKKVVKKCGGLPLAAKSLGGLLSYETDVNVWKGVLQSNIWDLGDQGDGIIPALRLSYLHLPGYLKQCFLYASAFPKDYIFRKNHIVQQWMAQGFLQCKGSKQAEDVGNMYFKELVQRSSFEYHPGFHDKEDPCFAIHDLIHDLAQHISGQEFFQMEGNRTLHVAYPNIVRHLSVVDQKLEDLEKMLHAPWAIRTLMVKVSWGDLKFPISQALQLLQSLRALDLHRSRINGLPDPVGNLKHLRYLNLNYTGIESLPDSICKLYNLQTLSLLECKSLTRLPKDIKNLINLRCLMIEGSNIEFLPRGFGKLTSLRALDEFRVGFQSHPISNEDLHGSTVEDQFNCSSLQPLNEECGGIEELKDLVHLRGRLQISRLQWVMNVANDAAAADLRNKQNIRELVLSWRSDKPALPDVQVQVIESLRPPDHLEVLRIYGYDGPSLPTWMAGDLFPLSKLARVTMEMCRRCARLPFGQLPSLKHLEIRWLGAVKTLGPEFCGQASVGFPALEELVFSYMSRWVKWELAALRGAFPCLRYLSLYYCLELESIVPLYLLPALEVLHIWHCPRLGSIELRGGLPWTGPPPLKKMRIVNCQEAYFSPEDGDDEDLLLPPTLQDLTIITCPSLIEWCERGGGSRLAHIPNAKVWRARNDAKVVTTLVPEVNDGKLVLKVPGHGSSYSEVRLRPQDDEEED